MYNQYMSLEVFKQTDGSDQACGYVVIPWVCCSYQNVKTTWNKYHQIDYVGLDKINKLSRSIGKNMSHPCKIGSDFNKAFLIFMSAKTIFQNRGKRMAEMDRK